jgi:uncharacterized protein YgiM (DUF1202 family)
MKTNCWLIFGAMLSTSLLAQQVADAPPSAPLGAAPPAVATPTNPPASSPGKAKAPAKKSSKKAAPAKKDPGAELKTVPLVPGAAVVDANNVNVRGQAKLKSEIVTRLSKGQPVTVLEEIVRNNSGSDEPSAWAKILLPTNANVWVHTTYIDPTNKTVVPRKLNVRSGPGENFSVLGVMARGEAVVDAGGAKGSWLEIKAPTNAYAFVASQYLKQEPPAATPAEPAKPAEPPATPATVTEPPTVAAAPGEPPSTPPTAPGEQPAVTNVPPELAAATNAIPVEEEPPPKRIVQRQGQVRGTASIQAPTQFALFSVETGRMIDYLYTTSPNLDLRRYKGLQIIVTGEEGLEDRWGNTPVITIQKIQVVE